MLWLLFKACFQKRASKQQPEHRFHIHYIFINVDVLISCTFFRSKTFGRLFFKKGRIWLHYVCCGPSDTRRFVWPEYTWIAMRDMKNPIAARCFEDDQLQKPMKTRVVPSVLI